MAAPNIPTSKGRKTRVPSDYRNKTTKVRYGWVQDPDDPSGRTKVRTEHGVSSFEIATANLEFAPLDAHEHDGEMMNLDEPPGVDMSNHQEIADLAAPYGAVWHEPVTADSLVQQASERDHDFLLLSRSLPYNLGEAVRHIWAARKANGTAREHLGQARFHLADEMQRIK